MSEPNAVGSHNNWPSCLSEGRSELKTICSLFIVGPESQHRVETAGTQRNHGYLSDDRCAVVLSPLGGRGTLALSGAPPVAPATLRHLRGEQTGRAGGQLATAGANQRDLGYLQGRKKILTKNTFFFSVGSVLIVTVYSA